MQKDNIFGEPREGHWGLMMSQHFIFFIEDGSKYEERKCLMTASTSFFNTGMEGISTERKKELTQGQKMGINNVDSQMETQRTEVKQQ